MPTPVRTTRTTHPTRTRLLAATTAALAALVLTACENGEGVRDEGPSQVSQSSSPSTANGSDG